MRTVFVAFLCFALSCAELHEAPVAPGQDIRITFLHTADIHSRLLPYRMHVTYTDKQLGLLQENEPFGGIARIAHIINRERKRAGRVVYVDSGDVFQGAPIFNAFHGEAEFRALSYLAPDAVAIGNHEFDAGLPNLVTQIRNWVSFPLLAANYYFMPDNGLIDYVQPYTIINVDGVKIAFIGLGDFDSLSSITDIGNNLKILPMNNIETINDYVGILRPYVDLVVLVSHAGLSDDLEIAAQTKGVDIIFGGHIHIVLNPPKVVRNAEGRDVLIVHSGAFAKFVGRLDVVLREDGYGGMHVVSHTYKLFPVDSTVPEDPIMAEMMEGYRLKLNQLIDLTSVYGYSPKLLPKYGTGGGDSPLGNLVAEAIRRYARVDVAFTNTLGIRTSMYPGPITLDDMYNMFPFENTITIMYMSGADLRAMLDYVARRSSGRGCVSQLQVAGMEFVINCNPGPPPDYIYCHDVGQDNFVDCHGSCGKNAACYSECLEKFRDCILDRTGRIEDAICLDRCMPKTKGPLTSAQDKEMVECFYDCFPRAEDIIITDCPNPLAVEDISTCRKTPLEDKQIYEVATNDYIAHGGSGFTILKSNNTQVDTGLPLRDAVLETIITSGKCLEYCRDRDGELDLERCSVFKGCIETVNDFLASFCDRVDKTGGQFEKGKVKGCALDTGACSNDYDCYHVEIDCADGHCMECNNNAQCMVVDPQSICVDHKCFKRTYRCFKGRCYRTCELDTDCPGKDSSFEFACVRGHCLPAPATACFSDKECVDPISVCFGNSPSCQSDADCPDGFVCHHNLCIPERPECSTTTDCQGDQQCVFGRCTASWQECVESSDCGPEGKCVGGICSLPCGNCTDDTQCPAGLSCVKNLCVHINATCRDFRCRTHCTNDTDCKSGELCMEGGLCMPALCYADMTREEACRLNALVDSHKKCLSIPCVDSRADGRIRRILPENLGDLEFGFIPDNPEDIDVE